MASSPVSPATPDRPLSALPMWRRAAQAGLEHVFGPLPIDANADPGDPGVCGPGSASWRVIGDTAAMVGGFRALLVQLLHPHAMAGVYDHSAFRTDPLGRLKRTSAYVLATTFGSTREVLAVSRVVRQTHRTVKGVAPDGTRYAASQPHLLAWVSIALTSSFLAADRTFHPRPITGADADEFVAQQLRIGALLDPRVNLDAIEADLAAMDALRAGTLPLRMVDDGTLPSTVAELDAALERYRPELTMNEQGREGMRFLLWPPIPPAIKVPYLPLLAGALSTIPREERRLFGPRAARLASPLAIANTRVLVGTLRRVRGPSPLVAAAAARSRRQPC